MRGREPYGYILASAEARAMDGARAMDLDSPFLEFTFIFLFLEMCFLLNHYQIGCLWELTNYSSLQAEGFVISSLWG